MNFCCFFPIWHTLRGTVLGFFVDKNRKAVTFRIGVKAAILDRKSHKYREEEMVGYLRRVLVLSVAVVLLVGCSKEHSPDEIAKKAREKYESMEDYQAVYVQTIKMGGNEVTVNGNILAKGDRMRMDLRATIPGRETPMEQLVVSDGKVIWTYNSMANTVQKVELFRLPEEIQKRIKEEQKIGFWIPEIKDEMSLDEKGEFYVLQTEEEPESKSGEFFSKTLYYIGKSDFFLHRIEFYNNEELGIVFEFKDIQLNTGISDDRFVFEPSEGVEVIDMTDDVNEMIEE